MGGKKPGYCSERCRILKQAVEAVISGAFRSSGQKCTATSRVIVDEIVLR